MENKKKKGILVIALLMLIVISIFVVAKKAVSVDFHEKTLHSLDEKRNTVLELAAASAAASTAVTMIPGDTATPIAEKLADLSSYFLVILSAIILEKYLVTITGYLAFQWLIPIALLCLIAGILLERDFLKLLAARVILFSFAISFVVPVSVKLSNLIESTHQESIQATIEEAKKSSEVVEELEEDQGLISGIFSKVEGKVADAVDKFNQMFNQFLENVAILLVTSCLIPVAVIFVFLWLIRTILGVDIKMISKDVRHKDPTQLQGK